MARKGKSKPDIWMPLVIGDYLKNTSRLTTEQHGAYLLLIMDYWVNGPPLDDDDELAAITKLELRAWRRQRSRLVRFFTVEDGRWRHARLEEDLAAWTERKTKFSARSSAGGKAKAEKARAAKSGALSTPQAVLAGCTSSSAEEVDAPSGQSTSFGREPAWTGPAEVWAAFKAAMGEAWIGSWLAKCGWQDLPERALIAPHGFAASRIRQDAGHVLRDQKISVVVEKAA